VEFKAGAASFHDITNWQLRAAEQREGVEALRPNVIQHFHSAGVLAAPQLS